MEVYPCGTGGRNESVDATLRRPRTPIPILMLVPGVSACDRPPPVVFCICPKTLPSTPIPPRALAWACKMISSAGVNPLRACAWPITGTCALG